MWIVLKELKENKTDTKIDVEWVSYDPLWSWDKRRQQPTKQLTLAKLMTSCVCISMAFCRSNFPIWDHSLGKRNFMSPWPNDAWPSVCRYSATSLKWTQDAKINEAFNISCSEVRRFNRIRLLITACVARHRNLAVSAYLLELNPVLDLQQQQQHQTSFCVHNA